MSETKNYQGWKNYETWNVALWFDNDEPRYKMRLRWTEAAWRDSETRRGYEGQTREDSAKFILSQRIKDYVESNNPISQLNSMYVDLLNAAISEVDWYEIAESWLQELEER